MKWKIFLQAWFLKSFKILYFLDNYWMWWISMLLLTSSFVTWAERKTKVSDIQNSSRSCVYKYSSTMFQQMIYFVIFFSQDNFSTRSCLIARDGRARIEGRGDICRQSLSRQMSDNTIVWWVWMTGSFVSPLVVVVFVVRFISFSYVYFFCATCQRSDNCKSIFFYNNWLLFFAVWTDAKCSTLQYFFWYFIQECICQVQSADKEKMKNSKGLVDQSWMSVERGNFDFLK